MKNLLLLLLAGVLLTSCVSYNRINGERVTHVLAITQSGDTIQVPMNELRRNVQPDYYNNWELYGGNNWYWGNVWYPHHFSPYRYGYWDDWYWRRRPIVINPTPSNRTYVPRHVAPRGVESPIRGRSNQPQVRREITPQQPRTNPTQPRTPIREVNPSRGSSTRSPVIRQQPTQGGRPTRGGVIKQN